MATGDIIIPVNVPTGGERGDIPDHQLDANFFRFLQNMHINAQGRLVLRDGYEQLASSGLTSSGSDKRCMGLVQWTDENGNERTAGASRTRLFSYASASWTNRTGTAMTASDTEMSRWQVFATAGAYKIIHVNGKDVPQTGDGNSNFTNLGGTPPANAADVTAAANRVLMLDLPDEIRISDFNDPATWPAALTVRLVDRGDIMLGMERIGRLAVAIYGEDSQWIARAQLGSFPFRFEKIDEKPGPISKGTVVPDGNIHYYLGVDGIVYRFDGVNVVPWHKGMQDYVRTNLGFDNRAMAHGVLIGRIRHIFWFFPLADATSPNAGVYLDLDRRAMGRIAIGSITASSKWITVALNSWDSLSALSWTTVTATYSSWDAIGGAAEPREILGDASGQVHAFGSGDGSDNGTAIEGIWELPLRPWAGPDKNFIPLEFETYFVKTSNATTITPAIRSSDTLMAAPSLVNLNTFDIATDQRNSIDLSDVADGAGKRFISLRHTVSTSNEGGNVSWLGGVLSGESAEVTGGPTGTS